MAPANPLQVDSPAAPSIEAPSGPEGPGDAMAGPELVSQQELNSWRRGFTPQAELWNGRLAMLGLSVGIGVLLLARLVQSLQAA
jgi:hypothetical protein